jgi:hypothetical protein
MTDGFCTAFSQGYFGHLHDQSEYEKESHIFKERRDNARAVFHEEMIGSKNLRKGDIFLQRGKQ